MSDARLQREADGRLQLQGELSFATVPALWRHSLELLSAEEQICVDLKQVQRSDSAGLALLVEWMRAAKRLGKPVQFLNMPQQMLDIARVSSLDQVLPLSRG